jgi:hypothetical protein
VSARLDEVEIDPPMRAWLDALVEAGWRIERVEDVDGVVSLRWPRLARVSAIFDNLEVPMRTTDEFYAERFSWMRDVLAGVCQLAARIRELEAAVYDEHLVHGWERETPIKWIRREIE